MKIIRLIGSAWVAAALFAGSGFAALSPLHESQYSAERDLARNRAETIRQIAGQVRSNQSAAIHRLETEIQAGRSNLTAIQKEWVAQLVRDDSAAIRRIRAETAALQNRIDADESELNLLQKHAQEYEREAGAWQNRADLLDLALRLDLKVLLATPEEIAHRTARVEEARKDIEQQRSQIRKYRARRQNAFAEIERIGHDLAEVRAALKTAEPALQTALENRRAQLLRRIDIQREWAVFNHSLESHAVRNLAFARSHLQILRDYAEALRIKGVAQQAEAAQLRAQQADAALAAQRSAIRERIRSASQAAQESSRSAEELLRRMSGDSPAGNVASGRSEYAQQRRNVARWEAEAAAWDEYLALQKAVAAFAHEQADRLSAATQAGTPKVIAQEERLLRDSLKTSDEYVFSLQALLEQADRQVEMARSNLGIDPAKVARLRDTLAETARRANGDALPPLSQILPVLSDLGADLRGATAPDIPAEELLFLTFRRVLLADRLQISRDWLEHSRGILAQLNRQTTALLWRQSDPRLEWMSIAQLGDFIRHAGADLVFATQVIRYRATVLAGYPSPRAGWAGILAALLLIILAQVGARRLESPRRPLTPGRAYAATCLKALPWALMGLALASACPFNPGLQILGYAGPAFFGWVVIRAGARRFARDGAAPAGASFSGAAYCALNTVLTVLAVLAPFYFAARTAVNAWPLQTLLSRMALLGIGFAFFRLIFHPTLLGRFLSRHSQHILLRVTGGSIAWICIGVCTLAILPRLAALDALAQSLAQFTGVALLWLVINLVGNALLHWGLARKMRAGFWRTLILRTAQFLLAGIGLALIGLLGWQLIDRFLLAPNTPTPVQYSVRLLLRGGQGLGAIWRHGLFGGMTVASLTRGILVFLFFIWLSRRLKNLFHDKILSRTPMDTTTRITFASILGYLIILLGFVVGLNVAGSSLQNLALLAGAITVGLGFGLQNIINNFVSSLLIHFGRTIRVGDYIDVAGQRGTVREIGFRNTVINTDDGITVLVPNGSFVTANIINWTNPCRKTRIHIPLVIQRSADLAAVSALVAGRVGEHPLILSDPAPTIEVRAVTADKLSIEILAWTENPEKMSALLGELNLALDPILREKGYL